MRRLTFEIVPQSVGEAARKGRHTKNAQSGPKGAAALTPERREEDLSQVALEDVPQSIGEPAKKAALERHPKRPRKSAGAHPTSHADIETMGFYNRCVGAKYVPSQLLRGIAGIGSSAHEFREVTEAYDVLSDPQRRQGHDVDLARTRARCRVQPEPLIPATPRHVVFRPFHAQPEPLIPETPRHIRPSAFGIDQEIARIFQMMEGLFGQIW